MAIKYAGIAGKEVRILPTTGYEPLFANNGKALLGVKDRKGNSLKYLTEGEIILLAEGLTVAMINKSKRRHDLTVRAHAA